MSVGQKLGEGCYHLAPGVHLSKTEKDGIVALCDYPLRVVPLNPTLAKLLSLCAQQERNCGQLATEMQQPLKRVQAWCDQLCRKSLLMAGPSAPPSSWPTITIIIPSYNRVFALERCLRALFALDYPCTCLEILVIDDASTDATQAMLTGLMQEAECYQLRMRCVRHEQRQGVACSRNTGAKDASHDILAYIDSDCVATPAWLNELVPVLQNPDIAVVGGMIRGYDKETILGRYEDVCSSLYMGARSQSVRLNGSLTYLPTANLLVRRSVWQTLGGFALLTQGEDVDFCRRVLLLGGRIHYEARGVVYHDYRTTLKSFLKIRAAYATAEAVLLQRYPNERRSLLLPPAQAIFAGLVLSGLWGMFYGLWLTSRKRMRQYDWVYGRERAYSRERVKQEDRMEQDRGKPCPYYTVRHGVACHAVRCIVGTGLAPVMLRDTIVFASISAFIIALFTTLFSTRKRMQRIRRQLVSLSPIVVFKAMLRGNLAYTYHLCRHITRYYTLPLALFGIIVFPVGILIAIMLCAVVVVDYWRLKPHMNFFEYAFCAILSDCAYEIGVLQGCVKQRTWKPLIPIIKK